MGAHRKLPVAIRSISGVLRVPDDFTENVKMRLLNYVDYTLFTKTEDKSTWIPSLRRILDWP
jgi:hypothetical protein